MEVENGREGKGSGWSREGEEEMVEVEKGREGKGGRGSG